MAKSVLAPHLRALREAGDFTQADVSKLLNIQRQTYCNYENDSRTPSIETIIDLADFFHVSIDELVREHDIAAPPAPDTVSVLESCPALFPHEQALIAEFRMLSPAIQKEILDFVHFKRHLISCVNT